MQDAAFQKELERLRLNGKNVMLVVTDHFLVYADARGTQRVPLTAVSKITTDRSGGLTIDAQPHGVIEGHIRNFNAAELGLFFERLKLEITRAKQDALNVEAAQSKPGGGMDWTESFPPPHRSPPTIHPLALLASISLAAVMIAVLYWFLPSSPWFAVAPIPFAVATYLLISRRRK